MIWPDYELILGKSMGVVMSHADACNSDFLTSNFEVTTT